MSNRFIQFLAILGVLAFSVPVFARSMSQPLELNQPAMIGTTTLQPGYYEFKADPNSNQIRVVRDGKLIATVEGKTVTLHEKPSYGSVVMNGHRIHEVQFAGRIEAIEIPNS